MRTVLNVIWLLLCGIWLALGYLLAGVICCVLIVTIPFGLASFRIAEFALWPFGRRLVKRSDAGAPSLIGNIVWIVFAGWWLAIGHIATAIALAVTIIGIPLAIANLKLIPVSLLPLGRVIVNSDELAPGVHGSPTARPDMFGCHAVLPETRAVLLSLRVNSENSSIFPWPA